MFWTEVLHPKWNLGRPRISSLKNSHLTDLYRHMKSNLYVKLHVSNKGWKVSYFLSAKQEQKRPEIWNMYNKCMYCKQKCGLYMIIACFKQKFHTQSTEKPWPIDDICLIVTRVVLGAWHFHLANLHPVSRFIVTSAIEEHHSQTRCCEHVSPIIIDAFGALWHHFKKRCILFQIHPILKTKKQSNVSSMRQKPTVIKEKHTNIPWSALLPCSQNESQLLNANH